MRHWGELCLVALRRRVLPSDLEWLHGDQGSRICSGPLSTYRIGNVGEVVAMCHGVRLSFRTWKEWEVTQGS